MYIYIYVCAHLFRQNICNDEYLQMKSERAATAARQMHSKIRVDSINTQITQTSPQRSWSSWRLEVGGGAKKLL